MKNKNLDTRDVTNVPARTQFTRAEEARERFKDDVCCAVCLVAMIIIIFFLAITGGPR